MRGGAAMGAAAAALVASCAGPEVPPPAPGELSLYFSSRGEGEIAPCGCPKRPLGGLARRSAVLGAARQQGEVLVVDAGLSLAPLLGAGKTAIPETERRQRQLKAELVASAFASDGIDAMALGSSDWSLGTDFVRELVAKHALPVLAANLSCAGEAPFPGARVVTRAGLRVGFVGVTQGDVPGCEVSDPEPALRSAIASLADVDLTVVLLPTFGAAGHSLARQGLPADLVITTSGQSPANNNADPSGTGWVVGAGSRGKVLGLARLKPHPAGPPWQLEGAVERLEGEVQRLEAGLARVEARKPAAVAPDAAADLARQLASYHERLDPARAALAAARVQRDGHQMAISMVELGEEVGESPLITAMVDRFNVDISGASGLIGPAAARSMLRVAPHGPYAGADACASCHADETAQWRQTPHARAWDRLLDEQRAADLDCFSCHVTGAGVDGGAESPTDLRGLHGVQCEACHGPSRAHVADPTAHKPVKSPEMAVCTSCHDGERDGGRFDAAVYVPKVHHTAPASNPK